MRTRRIIIASLLLALPSVTVAQPPPETSGPGWVRPYRHFTFSGIVFDLDNGMWAGAIQWEYLRDCSNEEVHCLASPTFSVAVPRRCADLAAGHWEVGDVRTEVLLRHTDSPPSLHRGGSGIKLYLVSAGRPNVLYVYDTHLGIDAFWWDRSQRIDFVAMQRAGRLEDWLFNEANRPAWQGHHFERETPQAVGACRE